jgi:signal transduction histidine kinase
MGPEQHYDIQLIPSPPKIRELFEELIESAQKEILLVLPTPNAFLRQEKVGIIDSLALAAKERAVLVRVLTPADAVMDRVVIQKIPEGANTQEKEEKDARRRSYSIFTTTAEAGVKFRQVAKLTGERNVTILVADRRVSLAIELKDDTKADFIDAVGMGIYSTTSPTISSYVSFFEALWHENELKESEILARLGEEKTRRQAELLQDILTHDIRNYNHVARLSGEILREQLKDNEELQLVADSLLKAVEESTALVDRANTLGRIISQKNAALYPVNLSQSLETALALMKKIFPNKEIAVEKNSESLPHQQPPGKGRETESEGNEEERPNQKAAGLMLATRPEYNYVLADDLLGEVFANIFSNSIKYTEGDTAQIWIAISQENERYADPQKQKSEKHLRQACEESLQEEEGKASTDGKSFTFCKIAIADAGVGIPDELKEGLFSRYLKSAKGYSLGMSIIHALVVERYRGRIKIENRVKGDWSKGTLVELRLLKA